MSDYFVYGLFRPDNGLIFWIGASRRARRLKEDGRGKRRKIIQAFRELGYPEVIGVVIRDSLSFREAAVVESVLIYAFGYEPDGPLVNTFKTEGFGLASSLTRKKMSVAAKARDRTGEWEQYRRSRMSTPDVVAKLRAAHLGKPSKKRGRKFPSENAKIAQGRLGWITNDVTQTRIPKDAPIPEGWRRGRLPATDRARANMSAAVRPRQTLERRQAQGKRMKGQPIPWFHTPEVRARALLNRKGRLWITNGSEGRTIAPTEPVPDGWWYGRNTVGRPAWNLGLRRT